MRVPLPRALIALALAAALLGGCTPAPTTESPSATAPSSSAPSAAASSDAALARAFAERRTDLQVSGQGTVSRILADDNDGGRHQRFILTLASGQTLLVAHNIDVAPRISSLAQGDTVEFYGVYEYNEQGGVVHWTHHDPLGEHQGGWLKHEGKVYE